MKNPVMVWKVDMERAEEIKAFARARGWSDQELEGAIDALHPFEDEYFTWA